MRNGFYDGTLFHSVINGFMIQGGGFEPACARNSGKKEFNRTKTRNGHA